MDIEGQTESTNVEDRRGSGGNVGWAVGGVGGVILLLLGLILGIDPANLLNNGGQPDQSQRTTNPAEEKLAHFAKVVFHDTEIVWTAQFEKLGRTYTKPTLVLFSDRVESACGRADAAVGPFYCPGDSKVYIDLSFYRDMEAQAARAGRLCPRLRHRPRGRPPRPASARLSTASVTRPCGQQSDLATHHLSVRLELQADYFAGVWAHHGQREVHFLERGDIESALNAANQIGDDRLQERSSGHVVPDSFTHGTSEQRMHWFKKGFDTGDVEAASELFDLPYDKL